MIALIFSFVKYYDSLEAAGAIAFGLFLNLRLCTHDELGFRLTAEWQFHMLSILSTLKLVSINGTAKVRRSY